MRRLMLMAVGFAALVTAAPAQAGTKSCGRVNDFAFNIKASGLACAKAKKVARTYTVYTGEQDTTPLGYRCNRRTRANGTWKITCRKADTLITWLGIPVG
jgi:hypothetical protein